MTEVTSYVVAGERRTGDEPFEVTSPFDGSVVARVGTPTDRDLEEAVAAAARTFEEESRLLPTHARAEALLHISRRIGDRADEVAELIAREGGKPLKWARVEAARATSTFRWAAETIRAMDGEALRLDTDPALGSRLGIVRRFPYGPVAGIAPFNFPVNLVAHKMAPALAVGAPIIVKPASATPLGALFLAEPLVTDARIAKVSFTGSSPVGWKLKSLDPRKHFTLELGGNAGVIVHSDADLDHAAARVAFGGYYQAGQSCIAVQRIFVHAPAYDDFVTRLVKEVEALRVGDPMDPDTDVGPVIDQGSLERIGEWVEEAVSQGAEVLVGGERNDPFYAPTVVANVRRDMKVCKEEIFGPVTTVSRYETFEEALDEVNATPYGLQAGLFTRDVERAFLAHRDIRVGGLILNDVSAFRADQMPYGGTKDSGYGRGGVRYAMEEMTEPRIMVVSHIPL